MRKTILWGALVGLLAMAFLTEAETSFAQTKPILNFQNRGAQYLIGRGDELLIKVNIWGYVRMPGQYLVPSDTDLMSLISYAGGPLDGAQLKKVKLIRVSNLMQNSNKTNTNQKVFYYNIKKFLDSGDETVNPMLMPNDTIVIKGSTTEMLSKVFNFIVRLTPLLQAYYWYVIASKR